MSRYHFPPLPVPLGWDGNGKGVRLGIKRAAFPLFPLPLKGENEGN